MDNSYYSGYQLTDSVYAYDLSADDIFILDACIAMVSNRWTIRETARNTCFSKSTLHKHIHSSLPRISYELYGCVVSLLRENETRKFGGVNFGKRRTKN